MLISKRIDDACRAAKRLPTSVKLVAVSKTMLPETIRPVLEAGHRIFGENRVQEAIRKWPLLKQGFPGVELHLIGPLQSNKAAEAVALFDVIETVDRPKIATALLAEMIKQDRWPKIYVQVNTGDESQKAGVRLAEALTFITACQKMFPVAGLMCIPPVDDSAAKHFAILADLASKLGISSLSMGMSADFEIAIAAGATHVRVGSAIFGDRDVAVPK